MQWLLGYQEHWNLATPVSTHTRVLGLHQDTLGVNRNTLGVNQGLHLMCSLPQDTLGFDALAQCNNIDGGNLRIPLASPLT